MSTKVSWLPKRISVKTIGEMLRDTEYNGFPIISDHHRPIGVISRHVLMCLMAHIDCVEDCAGKEVLLGE
jgi:CBS domain containing-hemolysin-like protein